MVPAVSFQPEVQPEIRLRCSIWVLNDNFDRIQIFTLSFDLLPVHRMDIACSRLLLVVAKHGLDHRRMNFI